MQHKPSYMHGSARSWQHTTPRSSQAPPPDRMRTLTDRSAPSAHTLSPLKTCDVRAPIGAACFCPKRHGRANRNNLPGQAHATRPSWRQACCCTWAEPEGLPHTGSRAWAQGARPFAVLKYRGWAALAPSPFHGGGQALPSKCSHS